MRCDCLGLIYTCKNSVANSSLESIECWAIKIPQLEVVVLAFNSSTGEVETNRSLSVHGQPYLHRVSG